VQAIMWYLYILLCDKKTFYIGITNDLKKRFQVHKDKKSFFTKKFSTLEIIYKEIFPNKFEAAKREKQLKGWSRTKKEWLINGLQ
jgi:putative endonuclease